jgi:hypothetical protein
VWTTCPSTLLSVSDNEPSGTCSCTRPEAGFGASVGGTGGDDIWSARIDVATDGAVSIYSHTG